MAGKYYGHAFPAEAAELAAARIGVAHLLTPVRAALNAARVAAPATSQIFWRSVVTAMKAKFLHCAAPPSWCAARTSVLQEYGTRPECPPEWL
jgi:hypothetical protein